MRALVAPDAFKGTYTAGEVAAAVARGLRQAGLEVDECPVADGGEGTMAVLLDALGGETHNAPCSDPLGRAIRAEWGMLDGARSAIVESAQASGLSLVAPNERDAERASSAGTGELLLHAARAGARQILVAIGGTASTDGGRGAIARVQSAGGLHGVQLTALCDVHTPFERAASVFAAQKGAGPASVDRLAARLREMAAGLPRDPTGVPMSGAGGGLAGGLWAALDAKLLSGSELVLELLGVDRRMLAADAVIVGEGRLDAQSAAGKVAGEIIARARAHGVPAHAIVGSSALDRLASERLGLSSVRQASTNAEIEHAARELGSELLASGSAQQRSR